jgi:transposase InsO family protein
VPWKESCRFMERTKFVLRLEKGERMVDLCQEFGISRKTGYKLWERYKRLGLVGMFDESRKPLRSPQRMSQELQALLLSGRRQHPTWGPKKVKAWLETSHAGLKLPAPSSIGDLFKKHGLITRRRRARFAPPYGVAPLEQAEAANHVWCADFKGQFRLGNGKYCYPLTITDRFSRFLLACEGLESAVTDSSLAVFEMAFREYGLPSVIRTDNGPPFASRGLGGLSRLSVHWMRLGIRPERIEPAHPQQNGQHERMHLVLKQETTRPAAANFLQQQERFDRFVHVYNQERPHEGLDQRTPASHYQPSPRPYPETLPEPAYPLHDVVRTVNDDGRVHLWGRSQHVYLSTALTGQLVGLREVRPDQWLVTFMHLDLGIIDGVRRTLMPLPHPAPADAPRTATVEPQPPSATPTKVSPMSPV